MRWLPPLALVVAACVTTRAAMINPAVKLSAICPDGVLVFTDTSRVGKPYTEVAVLNSQGDYQFTDESSMIESQRKKAAKLGANGVILGDTREPSTSAKVFNALLGTGANRRGRAVAILIPEDSTRVAAACVGDQNRVRT